jgi:hypothetical protein
MHINKNKILHQYTVNMSVDEIIKELLKQGYTVSERSEDCAILTPPKIISRG